MVKWIVLLNIREKTSHTHKLHINWVESIECYRKKDHQYRNKRKMGVWFYKKKFVFIFLIERRGRTCCNVERKKVEVDRKLNWYPLWCNQQTHSHSYPHTLIKMIGKIFIPFICNAFWTLSGARERHRVREKNNLLCFSSPLQIRLILINSSQLLSFCTCRCLLAVCIVSPFHFFASSLTHHKFYANPPFMFWTSVSGNCTNVDVIFSHISCTYSVFHSLFLLFLKKKLEPIVWRFPHTHKHTPILCV